MIMLVVVLLPPLLYVTALPEMVPLMSAIASLDANSTEGCACGGGDVSSPLAACPLTAASVLLVVVVVVVAAIVSKSTALANEETRPP